MRGIALAAFALAFANSAVAAPITSGSLLSYSTVLNVGATALFDFQPDQALDISISVSGTGAGADLVQVSYGYVGGASYGFDFVTSGPGAGPDLAGGFLPAISTALPFYVSFLLDAGASDPVGLSMTVKAVTPGSLSAVPAPAAALSLLTALAGFGFAARRRAATA